MSLDVYVIVSQSSIMATRWHGDEPYVNENQLELIEAHDMLNLMAYKISFSLHLANLQMVLLSIKENEWG